MLSEVKHLDVYLCDFVEMFRCGFPDLAEGFNMTMRQLPCYQDSFQ
jgi:hypothetical protein